MLMTVRLIEGVANHLFIIGHEEQWTATWFLVQPERESGVKPDSFADPEAIGHTVIINQAPRIDLSYVISRRNHLIRQLWVQLRQNLFHLTSSNETATSYLQVIRTRFEGSDLDGYGWCDKTCQVRFYYGAFSTWHGTSLRLTRLVYRAFTCLSEQ